MPSSFIVLAVYLSIVSLVLGMTVRSHESPSASSHDLTELKDEIENIREGLGRMYDAFHMGPVEMELELKILQELEAFKFDIGLLKRSGRHLGLEIPHNLTLEDIFLENLSLNEIQEYHIESTRLLKKAMCLARVCNKKYPDEFSSLMSSYSPYTDTINMLMNKTNSRQKRQLKYLKKVLKQFRYYSLRDTMANNVIVSLLLSVFAVLPNTAIELSELLVE